MAIDFKHTDEEGFDSFTISERTNEPGGVWAFTPAAPCYLDPAAQRRLVDDLARHLGLVIMDPAAITTMVDRSLGAPRQAQEVRTPAPAPAPPEPGADFGPCNAATAAAVRAVPAVPPDEGTAVDEPRNVRRAP